MAVVAAMDVGPIQCRCYTVWRDGATDGEPVPAVVIDPGDEADVIAAELRHKNLKLEAILLTHAHVDHIGGVDELLAEWPEAFLACSAETSRRAGDPRLNLSVMMGPPVTAKPAGRILADGEEFELAGLKWRAVEIPGHDPGEMAYILGDGEKTFTGDVIFAGSVGRSDFPGGDGRLLVEGILKLLAELPKDGVLYPGHGPSTTVAAEERHNPFLR